MLIDVLTQVAADTGLDSVQKRDLLLQLLNRAAREMYDLLESNKLYREVTLVVPSNKVVALPSFIGELRGMRMHTNELPFDLHSLAQPRYVNTTLQHKFKNWRDMGESAIHTDLENVGVLTLTCPAIETENVTVSISGQTNNASKVEELVLINDTSVDTTNQFGPAIFTISCLSKRENDITIYDADGNEIAILYNTAKKTRYKLVDVSQIFWTIDTTDSGSYIDVLYKVPKIELYRDTDSFFAGDDFDEAWYNMTMHLFLKPLQNRQSDSQAFAIAALNILTAAKESAEQGMVKKISFGRNKFFGIFRKYRYFPGSVTNVDNNVQT